MEIKDVIHLYLGCPIWDSHNEKEGILFGINNSGVNNVKILHGEDVWNLRYESAKPILRPLSDMTEGERSAYLYFWGNTKPLGVEGSMKREAEATKFLLSKYFDLFGLIPAGLALDKTKQQ